MNQTIESRLIELLNARLCHDLISSVSAVNNGIELIAELGDDPGGEAFGLIAASAKEAARKLRFFRLAFGSARLPSGGDAGLADARATMLEWPAGERVSLQWPETAGASGAVARQSVKLMVLLGLVGLDCLGGAGRLTVEASVGPDDTNWEGRAQGERAALTPDMAAALTGQAKLEDLTAKTAPAAYAALQAAECGGRITTAATAGEVVLRCVMPAAR